MSIPVAVLNSNSLQISVMKLGVFVSLEAK